MPRALHPRPYLACVFALVALAACKVSTRDQPAPDRPARAAPTAPAPRPDSARGAPVAPPAPAPAPAPTARRAPPALDHEPIVNVLLASGRSVRFTLAGGGEAEVGGRRVRIPPGEVNAEVAGGGIRISGATGAAREIVIDGAAGFSAMLHPPFGADQRLTLTGTPVLALDGNEVDLIERLPLERYLAGVLGVEMSPSYPPAALAAQAVAARSYACARVLERFDQPWQLHWHFSVDMAYAGAGAKTSEAVRHALDQTRGRLLTYHRMPVPALFYASSGGKTESAANVWPNLRFADGTPAAAAMPVVDDPACEAGARGLKATATHWRWKADVPLADVGRGLQAWSREKPGERPAFGAVTSVRIVDRASDSGRVARVAISHKPGKKVVETVITGHDFRMAVGPGLVRSTAWDRCVLATAKNKSTILVLEGHGFGHGVGLSQISAWQMAHDGVGYEAILKRFYPGATLDDRW